ncbi:MAG: hypothetical protein HY303_04405 [Candidatus Wallbacteria bacterium]|nr:hypothetical protein [Candidatus Wallbacteria bacterium]
MSLRAFVEELRATGRVRVGRQLGFAGEDLPGLEDAILALDATARAELAAPAPELVSAAATWAFLMLHRGCQFLVYRDLGEALVEEVLGLEFRGPNSPAVTWSVDLALRCLPDLWALARGISQNDPLVVRLVALARQWPLSSVGIAGAVPVDVSAFIGHPGLAQLYADRILERGDDSRLDDPRVRELVRASFGAYPELAPRLVRQICLEAGTK